MGILEKEEKEWSRRNIGGEPSSKHIIQSTENQRLKKWFWKKPEKNKVQSISCLKDFSEHLIC